MSEQKIVIANCLDHLKSMPDECVDVCVTSPPYWALRDYGSDPVIWGGRADCEHEWVEHRVPARGGESPNANVGANRDGEGNNRGHPTVTQYCSKCGAWKGQLGLEPSPLEYIDHLMMIFDEVKRVLKPTGACWVNLGDTYATVSGSAFQMDKKAIKRVKDSIEPANELKKGLKGSVFREKSLCQIPSRFAVAMTDHGWILRNECIWRKENPMPTSTRDRFTVDFEKFFFFVKSPKYYFKQQFESMKQPIAKYRFGHQKMGINNGTYSGRMYDATDLEGRNVRTSWMFDDSGADMKNTSKWKDDVIESSVRQGMNQNRGKGVVEKRYSLPAKDLFLAYLRTHIKVKDIIEGTDISQTTAEHWFRSDDGFSFPSVEDWIKVRDKISEDSEIFRIVDSGIMDITYETDGILKNNDGEHRNARTTWTINTQASPLEHCAMFPKELIKRPIDACCPEGGVVLDPFCGSGTVLEYCWEKDIDAIGIEINPEYEKIIKQRANTGQTRLTDLF